MEREIRAQVLAGATGSLSALWNEAASRLQPGAEPSFADSLRRVRDGDRGGRRDGRTATRTLPARLLRHVWGAVQAAKVSAFHHKLDRLVQKLSDILKADFERSEARRDASHLRTSVGKGFSDAFDFTAMSRMLATSGPADAFPESRRKRIYHLLSVLGSRAFLPEPDAELTPPDNQPYTFVFGSAGEALEAFRRRMPSVMALAKAIAMAELEIDGLYRESRHDALFEQFGANGLDPQELAAFPDYLVCIRAGQLEAGEHARLMEILSSGLPIKVLLQIDDILEESPDGQGALTAGMRNRQIASMAIGLNDVYVLQTVSSHLFRCREHVLRGLTYRGPALFSVFSGTSEGTSGLPPYLVAAAALESRAFPEFAYDPSAGANWAARFRLDANPQRDLDWPLHAFTYQDAQHQRVSSEVAFTVIDFIAGDRRYAKHLARVPSEQWNGHLVPVDEALARERTRLPDTVPCLLMVDEQDTLHKVIVDERLVREARRCREMWHSLQELGGIHNSHAEALLARERKAWEDRAQAGGRDPRAGRARHRRARAAARRSPRSRQAAPRTSPRARRTRPTSRRRAARAATSARRSTTGCSPTTRASRRTSRTSPPAPTRSWWRPRRAARCP